MCKQKRGGFAKANCRAARMGMIRGITRVAAAISTRAHTPACGRSEREAWPMREKKKEKKTGIKGNAHG